ncbi:MAG: S8 family serine peptidase [Bdellovibrionales bacterium]|nr:S8 family serine peptidase [Bdellovibrionales bacterium]
MRALVLAFLLGVLAVIPALGAEFDARFVQPDTLIVKTRFPLGPNGAAELFESFGFTDALSNVRSVKPAFEGTFTDDVDFPADQYFTIRLRPGSSLKESIAALSALKNVVSVQPDYYLSDPDVLTPNDPQLPKQWYLDRLKVREAWEYTKGKGVFVADVESGFDTEHPDLKNQFDREKTFDYDPDTDDTSKVNDNKMSHGTPVCGLIGAQADNNLFGVGIAFEAKLVGSQMANSMSAHSTESVWTVNAAKAILGSVARGASVILIEKQLPSTSSSVEQSKVIYEAIKAAVAKGVPVVVPAGNFDNELEVEAAQEDSGAIFVGATTKSDKAASFSDYGERVDVAAPGESVYSTQQGESETLSFGGTSSASAITAGVTALVKAANPKLSPREIRKILKETGTPIEGTKKIGTLLNARDAVKRALDS